MKKHLIGVHVEKNAYVDGGNGLISFPNGQVITDGTKQRNGTVYDIASIDLSEYKGQVTAQHEDGLLTYVGEALGLAKTSDAVTISGIRFAVNETALGRIAYDLMVGGFPLDLSIETYGPWPDESDDTYYNAKLIGLSVVVVGNNKSATMGKARMTLVRNSLAQALEDGLDTGEVEKLLGEDESDTKADSRSEQAPKVQPTKESTNKEHKMFKTVKNNRGFAITVNYKNAAGEDITAELTDGGSVDVSEGQVAAVEKQINDAQAPKADVLTKEDLKGFLGEVKELVNNAVKPVAEKVEAIEQQGFDSKAKAPEFKKTENGGGQSNGLANEETEFKAMGWQERGGKQIQAAWSMLKNHDADSAQLLKRLNTFHLNQLKEKGIVANSLSLGDLGNFVISPELLSEIKGVRTNYAPLVNATEWRETLSTRMAWLARSGDIDMQPVAFLDDATSGAYPNGNLKPISTYNTELKTGDLEELAAVTPVMNSATRFLAADILADVAKGYRNDYDRKRAQLIIARLEQAIEAHNFNNVQYDVPSNVEAVERFLDVWTKIGEKTPNGTYILGTSSFSEIMKRALSAGTNGPLATIFTQGRDGVPLIFNRPYIVVADDLLPALNTSQTKSFSVDGSTVTVNHGVFYFDLSNFTGRTSGGLSYDLSMEAAYEDNGVVKSAYQRNEMVLRGSFFRGGQILDQEQVSSLGNVGVS